MSMAYQDSQTTVLMPSRTVPGGVSRNLHDLPKCYVLHGNLDQWVDCAVPEAVRLTFDGMKIYYWWYFITQLGNI